MWKNRTIVTDQAQANRPSAPSKAPPESWSAIPQASTGKSEASPMQGVLLVLVSAASFGAMPIFAKLAYAQGINLNTLLALRFTLGAIGMWLIWFALEAKGSGRFRSGPAEKQEQHVTKGVLAGLILMGAVGYVGQSFAYFTAVSLISASATGLLLYTYPALVTILARILLREALTLRKIAALCVSALGTLLVLGLFSGTAGGTGTLLSLEPVGVFWGLAAAAIYSAYIIGGARFTGKAAPIFSSAVIITAAAAVYIAWGILGGSLSTSISTEALFWALCISVVSTIVAITTFFAGLRVVGPSRASIVSTIEPSVTVGLAALVLGEPITAEQIMGGALILAAVFVLQLGRK